MYCLSVCANSMFLWFFVVVNLQVRLLSLQMGPPGQFLSAVMGDPVEISGCGWAEGCRGEGDGLGN